VLYGETQNAQWRELENDLSKVSENGDLVVLSASYMEIPLVFYDSNSRLNITSTLDENAAKNILENRSRAWLILSETRRELFLETISSNNLDISKRGEYKDDIFKNEESRGIYLYRVENIKSQ